jgi:hypothetical protein
VSNIVPRDTCNHVVLAITVDGRCRPASGIWEKAILKR